MTHYTKKRIETVSNSFRKNALSVAISALSTTLAGVRDGLKGGVYVTLIAGQVVAPVAWAELPTGLTNVQGGTVDAGAGNNATSATYDVTGSRVSADWTSFGISYGSSVTFNQQNTNAILVNQVTGNSLSNIAGQLNANGHIILVNPNGVTLAGTSAINVNSLAVAGFSGGGDLADFLDGTIDNLDLGSGSGVITIQDGANLSGIDQGVVLVGGSVLNGADITVSDFIGMGAGTNGAVTFDSNGIVSFEVSGNVGSAIGLNGISSTGALEAQQIFLTARNASAIYNNAINLEGTATASSINIDGDTVRLGAEVTLNGVSASLDIDNDGSAVTELTIGNSASIDFGTDGQAMAVASKVTIENGNTTLNNAQLTGADNEITLGTADFSITSVNNLNLANGALEGSAGTDTFEVTGAALTANAISVTNAASGINAGDGVDVLTVNDTNSTLTGTDNEIATANYAFSSVETVDLADNALTGTANADTFDVTGANALTSADIDFTNVSSVDAGNGADQLNTTEATLVAGTNEALTSNNISFTDIESADLGDGTLTGTANADAFDVTGANAITSAGIDFTNVEVVNADDGADQVSTDGADASLFAELGSAVDYALETLGITFRETENADLNGGTLAGSSEADSFEVTGTTLTANEISVTNAASAIDAGTGDDAITVNDTNSTLTGTDNELNTANYQFTSIESADLTTKALTGTANADAFDVTGANELTSAGIDFTNVASVDANDGDDQLNTSAAVLEAGTNEALTSSNISFTDIESADLSDGILTGTSNADTFDVTGANSLTSAGINFSNVAAVNADDGVDQVNTDGADASLFAELGSAVDYA
ncbi:MAG TPA: hypothetical protein DE015_10110, partial [Oceanospirillales bacterium]|nr:hypothetical protein [Oceanospirillales bacterium]